MKRAVCHASHPHACACLTFNSFAKCCNHVTAVLVFTAHCIFCQCMAWWLTLRAVPAMQSGAYTGSSAQLSKQGIIAVAVLVPLCMLLLVGLALHLAAKHGLLCNRPASPPEARAEGAEAGLGQGHVAGKPAPAGVQVRVDAT